jgi:hypothetical protein
MALPRPGEETHGNISFSSPAVLPGSGHIFFGTARDDSGGMHKVNPALWGRTW